MLEMGSSTHYRSSLWNVPVPPKSITVFDSLPWKPWPIEFNDIMIQLRCGFSKASLVTTREYHTFLDHLHDSNEVSVAMCYSPLKDVFKSFCETK